MRMHPGMMDPELIKDKKLDRATLKRAWGFAQPYKRDIAGYIGLAMISSALAVVPALMFRHLIDKSIPAKNLTQINVIALLIVAAALLTALLGIGIRWLGARVGEGLIADTRIALFNHVQRLPIGFFARTQTGSLMSRLNNDVVGAQQAFTSTLRTVVTDALTVIFTLGVMLRLSWQITLLSLIVVPLLSVISKRAGKLQEKAARKQMTLNASMNSFMTERFNVAGALLVKLFGNPKKESGQFSDNAKSVAAIGVQRAVTGVTLMLALPLVSALGTAAVYWWGARSIIKGEVELGTVVAIATLIQRLYGPLTDLASARVDFVTAFVSFERIFEVLDAPVSIHESTKAKDLQVPETGGSRVEAKDVWFRYPSPSEVSVASLENSPGVLSTDPSAWILQGISFVAEPGTLTALVGPSGAGKTTISQLIPRLYDVVQGSMTIGDTDVREATLESLRSSIGVVTQDAHMFHDSIAGNLRYAKPDATIDEIIAATTAAQIHTMISSLPDGYDTMVGERGYRLSGGEKQRLALARVLLKNPSVVILDEATAHLDSETESLIQEALVTALAGRTAIVIAHRLSTIQAADQILVLENGKIIERGRHEDLAGAGGLYAELYETQYLRAATPS